MAAVIAALIGAIATITAALITTRKTGPAGNPSIYEVAGPGPMPVARISTAFWLGLAGLVLWIIPILAYVAVLPGLYIGLREARGPRRLTGPGIALCALSLILALANGAYGSYLGARGLGWWQQ